MAVTVCLPLFGNPESEIAEDEGVNGRQLRELADQLGDRLRKAADALDQLTAAGWSARVAMFDVILQRAGVDTQAEATRQLKELGQDPEQFMIVEDLEDDDEND